MTAYSIPEELHRRNVRRKLLTPFPRTHRSVEGGEHELAGSLGIPPGRSGRCRPEGRPRRRWERAEATPATQRTPATRGDSVLQGEHPPRLRLGPRLRE